MKFIKYILVAFFLMTVDSCSSFNHTYYNYPKDTVPVIDNDDVVALKTGSKDDTQKSAKDQEQDRQINSLKDQIQNNEVWRAWVKEQLNAILAQKSDDKSKTILKMIKGCSPIHLKPLPLPPAPPTARFNGIAPNDKDAIIDLEADYTDALRNYIKTLTTLIVDERQSYYENCRK